MRMPVSKTETGRRERKKQQTRDHISAVARALFAERGFEGVTVSEIAREADVAEQTVYNHFPTKEDLVYAGLESFEERLLEAIRDRPEGESVPAAFGHWLGGQRGLLAEEPLSEHLVGISRMIEQSPALLAREQQIFARYVDSMARVIAADAGAAEGDIRPWVEANALIGIHRALISFTRGRIVAGASNPDLSREVRAQLEGALAALEAGFTA